jgi:hypothetical protein
MTNTPWFLLSTQRFARATESQITEEIDMEARASFGRSSVSKTFVAAILVIVAIGLAVMGAYVTKGLSGPSASQNHFAQPAPGTVLRQDNPVVSQQTIGPGSVLRQDKPVLSEQTVAPGSVLQQDRPGLSKRATDPGDDARTVRGTHGL